MLNIKKGNQVKVLSGKDKGKTGEILEINRSLGRVKIINNKSIFKGAIKLDRFLNYLFGKINLNKYIFFIVHFKIQPK